MAPATEMQASNVLALVAQLARPEVPDGVVFRRLATAPTWEVRAVWRVSAHDSPASRAVLSPWVDPDGGLGA